MTLAERYAEYLDSMVARPGAPVKESAPDPIVLLHDYAKEHTELTAEVILARKFAAAVTTWLEQNDADIARPAHKALDALLAEVEA